MAPLAASPSCPPLAANGRPAIDPASLTHLERCLESLPQTRQQHRRGQQYSWARHQLHRRIVAEVSAEGRCVHGQAPIALFSAGPPGAGKTTWLRQHAPGLLERLSLRIDADALRAKLPEDQGWNAAATQAEAGDLVTALLRSIGQPCRMNLLYDGTMTRPGRYLQLIPRLRQLGYRIHIVEIIVPEAVSQRRVLERYQSSGRYVPAAVIQEAYRNGPATVARLRPLVDGSILVDGATGAIRISSGAPLPHD
ncbi:MAG: zeta toxin family protein [Cyanobacteriota bacterium]|nr:zeta toxin family protein [Cyanobacteriota bacterium]